MNKEDLEKLRRELESLVTDVRGDAADPIRRSYSIICRGSRPP